MVSSVDVPRLVGTEVGRLSAVADDSDILLPSGSDLGRFPVVAKGDDVFLPVESDVDRLPVIVISHGEVPFVA